MSRSHANVSLHVQVSLSPSIDHEKFRVYSGFGRQLGPIVLFGAAGVIDSMAAFYPKTVTRLAQLALQAQKRGAVDAAAMAEILSLQYVISKAEEFGARCGVKGVKEAVFRLTGLGTPGAGRLPLKDRLPDGAWEAAKEELLADIDICEGKL